MRSLKYRDFLLYLPFAGCVAGGVLLAGPAGFVRMPAWLYVPILLLFAVSADARIRQYPQAPLVALFPLLFAGVLTVFSLLVEMPVEFWAFIVPNRFPLCVKALWAVLVPVLLHPAVECRLYSGLWRVATHLGQRGYWTYKLWITIPIVLLSLWPFHSLNLSPDGYDWLTHSIHPGHWIRYLREPLGTMIFRWVTLAGVKIGAWAPMISIGLATYLFGIATVALLWICLGHLCSEKQERFLWILAILASCGFTQVFMGNIEIYAVLMVFFALFLLAALRYLHGTFSPMGVGFTFALLFLTHLSAGWWIPAVLLLPRIRKSRPGLGTRSIWSETVEMAESSVLLITLFVIWLMWHGYGGDPFRMWVHFWGPQVMQVGADGAMFRTASEVVSWPVVLTMLNEYYCLSPVACGLFLFLPCQRLRPSLSQESLFVALLAGPYFVYSIVWRPDRKFPQDWDIFSGLTVPALLFLLLWLRERVTDAEDRARVIRPFVSFSGTLVIIQILYNHFLRISSWPLPG